MGREKTDGPEEQGMPASEVAHALGSYQALLVTLETFDDEAARGPSLLPRWTRAHVLAHLANNADANRRRLEGAEQGITVAQYPGGPTGREHEIELASRRPAAELVDRFRQASEAMFASWQQMSDAAWDHPIETAGGPEPARWSVWSRWREQEVHHVDLDLGFGPADWSRAFVHTALPRLVAGIGRRERVDGDEPAGEPFAAGSWTLISTDACGTWRVTAHPTAGTEVAELADDGEGASPPERGGANAVVVGPGWGLLAWLLGRCSLDAAKLEVTGDAVLAASLPGRYPFP